MPEHSPTQDSLFGKLSLSCLLSLFVSNERSPLILPCYVLTILSFFDATAFGIVTMSTPRLFNARGGLLKEIGVYGRDAWLKVKFISAILEACIRLLTGLFARILNTGVSKVGSAEKTEKTRLLELTSASNEPEAEPDAALQVHQREPDQRKTSLLFGERLPVPFVCVQHAFNFQALKYPSLPAVEHFGESVSYGRLDLLSTQLAYRLHSSGVNEGARVLLLAHRSIPFIVGLLGTLKAGASYIPLDGGIVTDETLRTIIQDANPKAVLCSRKYAERVARWDVSTHIIEDILESVEPEVTESNANAELKAKWRPENEAYVIYTSGTTGRPKGVSVSHANVTNLICIAPGNLNIQPGMRVSQLLNIAFDMCVWEVLGCLTNGGTLVLRDSTPTPTSSPLPSSLCLTTPDSTRIAIPFSSDRDATNGWLDLLKTVDVVIATPSILAKFDPKELVKIRTVAVAGEPCPQKLADDWAIGRSFYNCCGPTETTIINTAHLHRRGSLNSIGRPTPNNSVYVLDDHLRPVPVGHPGTLWAGGAGVSRGYVNRPDLTASKYKRDPFLRDGSLMYNTGDLGLLLPNGDIEHLGRVDDQVKIKGFRVELDGVASCISQCPGVTSSAALFEPDRKELWGFYTPSSLPESDVRAAVARVQPYYAVPRRFLGLETMPLTSNGKTDKAELRRRLVEKLMEHP